VEHFVLQCRTFNQSTDQLRVNCTTLDATRGKVRGVTKRSIACNI